MKSNWKPVTQNKKISKYLEIKKIFLNNHSIKEEFSDQIKNYTELNENENIIIKICEMSVKKC